MLVVLVPRICMLLVPRVCMFSCLGGLDFLVCLFSRAGRTRLFGKMVKVRGCYIGVRGGVMRRDKGIVW